MLFGWMMNYCWWLKSQTTTWDVWNLVNNGINYQPQLVQDFLHQQYVPRIWLCNAPGWIWGQCHPGIRYPSRGSCSKIHGEFSWRARVEPRTNSQASSLPSQVSFPDPRTCCRSGMWRQFYISVIHVMEFGLHIIKLQNKHIISHHKIFSPYYGGEALQVLDTKPDFTCGYDIWDSYNRTLVSSGGFR